MQIEILPDADAAARRAAAVMAAAARDAVALRGRFVVAVSGGRSPWLMLRDLADETVPWEHVEIVQVDERVAPAGHPDRNLTHLHESLLTHVPPRPEQIHAMPLEAADLEAAAAQYARMLQQIAGSPPGGGPGPPGAWHRRAHGVSCPRRSRSDRDRRRRGGHWRPPEPAAHDADVSDAESFAEHCVAGDGQRQNGDADPAAHGRSIDPGRTGSAGA